MATTKDKKVHNFKNKMMSFFQEMNDRLQKIINDPALYAESIAQDPSTKYREDIFNALHSLNLGDQMTALITLEVRVDATFYDPEISEKFAKGMVLPAIQMCIKYHKEHPIYRHLNDEQLLIIAARGCHLEWKV